MKGEVRSRGSEGPKTSCTCNLYVWQYAAFGMVYFEYGFHCIFGIWVRWYIWNLTVLILYFGCGIKDTVFGIWDDNNGNVNHVDVDDNMDRVSTCFGQDPNRTPTPPFQAHICTPTMIIHDDITI